MNCSSCGANLPEGAAACPYCGAPTPYNVRGPDYSGPNDPTAISANYGAPQPPSTGYGAPPYGAPAPPSGPYDPYALPTQPANPYSATPPPPLPLQANYAQPKRRGRVGLIVGIVLLVILLACVGISFAVYQGLKSAGSSVVTSSQATSTAIPATVTATTGTTPTTQAGTPTAGTAPPTGQGTPPSGAAIDPSAAAIVTDAKTTGAVDNNFYPTQVTNTFATGKPVYVTFNLNLRTTGYAVAKWYLNGQYMFKDQVLTLDKTSYDHGYFPSSGTFHSAGQGAVELYWCRLSDCSDGKLATVAYFTVTSSGMQRMEQPLAARSDIERRES